jgi:hypothetical protein
MKKNIMTIKKLVAENERFESLSGRRVCSLLNMSLCDDITYARPPEKTKSATDKPNALGDVEIISEE